MALLDVTHEESAKGFSKGLDENSTALILENLQKFQYKYPIDSAVREVVSNAVDSVREKNIAKAIISGQASVSDYYDSQEGAMFESSKFNRDYYDLNFLSSDDAITITYNILDDVDTFVIQDYGVGLGGSRLEGFFQLAYSSKRLSKSTLGRYGLGAKAPLATGCDSFTVESVYNGKLFKFEVFTHKVDSIIGKWGVDGINDSITFSNGYNCYYEKTTEKNGVKIIIPVKKHNRHKYSTAINKQLMYLPEDISFYVVNELGISHERYFKAERLFETDDIIISQNNYFTRPHIVLNNTVYGAIDFEELDLEVRYGSVGFKLDIENIDISPSREEVLWTARTKAEILKKYEAVTATASEYISKELKNLPYFTWMQTASELTKNNNKGALYHLGRICNLSTVQLLWDKDTTKSFSLDLTSMWGKNWQIDNFQVNYKGRPDKSSSNSTNVFCRYYKEGSVFLKDCNYVGKLPAYLSSENYLIIVFKKDGIIRDYIYQEVTKDEASQYIDSIEDVILKRALKEDLALVDFFLAEGVERLSSVTIPEEFSTPYISDESDDGFVVNKRMSSKERLALLKSRGELTVSTVCGGRISRSLILENTLAEGETYIYGFQEDKNALLAMSLHTVGKPILQIAKKLTKKFSNQIYIGDIKPSIDSEGIIRPHALMLDYIKYELYNWVRHLNYLDYVCRTFSDSIIQRIDELKDIFQYATHKSYPDSPFLQMVLKYLQYCVTSELSQESVFKLYEDELKKIYPGGYTGVDALPEEGVSLYRRYAAFLEVYRPLLNTGLSYSSIWNEKSAAKDLIEYFINLKLEEYGYPLTLNLLSK